jgi:uncharacterized protein YukJ
MKKLFLKFGILFIGFSLLTMSCSEQSDNLQNDSTSAQSKNSESELNLAKNLFIEMIKTEDYLNYKIALNNFADKMNGNTVFFKTRVEYIDWITNNLSKTNFSSRDEFITAIDDMAAKNSILENKNIALYGYLSNADQNQFLEIVQPSLGTIPTITNFNSCTNQCISDYNDAENGNEWAYANNYGIGDTNFAHNMATSIYWIRVKSIIDSFSACVGSC